LKKAKIKICFILTHLPQGGAERQTINLIRGLDESIYETTLLLYGNGVLFYKEILDMPVRLILNRSSSGNKILRNIKNAIFLRKNLKNNDFDILHTLLSHNGFWVRLLAPGKYRNRIIYSMRNDIHDDPRVFLWFEKLFINKSVVITNSLKVLNQFRGYIGQQHAARTHLIYNGFEIDKFMSDRPAQISDVIILGTVGRQSWQKNQIQILEAIAHLTARFQFHFFLIGDRSLKMGRVNEAFVTENHLDDKVTILDSVSGIEVFYKRFNIFVLSSVYESCPNVLFEAMLARCLCIVSSGANTDNFIRDGENGLVYDGSLAMLQEKIVQAVSLVKNNDHLRMVEEGCIYARTNFSLEKMVSSYEEIYDQVIRVS
jgi:glycosyltransferase involved in cell wall biosynthesis